MAPYTSHDDHDTLLLAIAVALLGSCLIKDDVAASRMLEIARHRITPDHFKRVLDDLKAAVSEGTATVEHLA